jgi:sugar phosphate isomerase/epimerase
MDLESLATFATAPLRKQRSMQSRIELGFLLIALLDCASAQSFAETPANLKDDRLIAWCIVPFDAKNRGPAERAEMVKRLGLKRVAYDWRQQHVPTFEDEILQYRKHGIEFFAFWGVHDEAFKLFKRYDLHPQIWQTLTEGAGTTEAEKVESAAKAIEPLAKRTAALGCKLGLYNHGGWGGEPQNLVAVCKLLRERGHEHVGIVYNLHHGHGHLDDFAEVLKRMQPYLLCLNLNGMNRGGDERGEKILPLGAGEFDVKLLKIVADSGYEGPVGVIGHTQDDVELRLQDNLDGLHWILPQLEGGASGERPKYRTWSEKERAPNSAPGEANSSPVPEYSAKLVASWIPAGQSASPSRAIGRRQVPRPVRHGSQA